MNIDDLKRVIVEQREEIDEILSKEKIIERELPAGELLKSLTHPNILVISGIRRSGKSILSLCLLKRESYGYINFDDERLASIETEDLNRVLQAFYELYGDRLDYLIFDEIQNIPGWQLFANRLRRTKRIILTGSNANLLSGELATHLTGRYLDFILYPFSFREVLKLKDMAFDADSLLSTRNIATIKNLMNEYLILGGFPEAYKFGKAIISKVYSDIIARDILFRYRIRDKMTFRELSKYLVSNFAQEAVFARLSKTFAIKDVHTVRNYVGYLGNSYLIFLVEKFSFKLKQQILAPKKIYCLDTGLINSVAFQFSDNKGRLMENAVAVELQRRKAYFNRDLEIYYWKDYSGREVDFVLKEKQRVKNLLQVSYDLNDISVKEREFRSLIAASEELGCDQLTVITWEEEREEKYKGKKIQIVPLWKWLLFN